MKNVNRTISRRTVLKAGMVLAGAAAGAGPLAALMPRPSEGQTGPKFQRPPEPNPKRGGTLRVVGPHTVPHFDIYQGAWPINMLVLYNGLVRKNLADGLRTIIPDLAERWELGPDKKSYTFHLRSGVKYHDGTPFSSADVVATFTKILNPPSGVISVFRDNFAAVERVEAVNPLTVRIRLKAPTAYFIELLTGGTNQLFAVPIYSKKILDETNYDLRKLSAPAPGTGPFVFKEHKAAERWVYERNPNYWDPELPYIDRLELLHVPQYTDRGSAILAGQADLTWNTSVDAWREGEKKKDQFGVAKLPSLGGHTAHINNERKPFSDARVRRAIFLAVSRQNIHTAYQDQEPMAQGRWMDASSPFSMPSSEILQLPGYRADKTADVAEAKRLLAAAGFPNGFGPIELVSATAPWAADIMAPAFAEELKRQLNITSKIRLVERGLLPEQYKNGTFDILVETQFVGAIADPTPMWNAFLKCKASQNYSRWCNATFDKLLQEIGEETDEAKRRQLMIRAEEVLDTDAPFVLTGFGSHSAMWRSYVKGMAIEKRIHTDWGHFDTVWLDK
jgi:peptide/nickel transport system substrate-binding protein